MKKIWNGIVVTIFGVITFILLMALVLVLGVGTTLLLPSKIKNYLTKTGSEFKIKYD